MKTSCNKIESPRHFLMCKELEARGYSLPKDLSPEAIDTLALRAATEKYVAKPSSSSLLRLLSNSGGLTLFWELSEKQREIFFRRVDAISPQLDAASFSAQLKQAIMEIFNVILVTDAKKATQLKKGNIKNERSSNLELDCNGFASLVYVGAKRAGRNPSFLMGIKKEDGTPFKGHMLVGIPQEGSGKVWSQIDPLYDLPESGKPHQVIEITESQFTSLMFSDRIIVSDDPEKEFQQAIRYYPNNSRAYSNMAIRVLHAGNAQQEAERLYQASQTMNDPLVNY